jgi:hypothetical protein
MSAYLTTNETLSVITKSITHYATQKRYGESSIAVILNKYHSINETKGWLNVDNKEFEERFYSLLLQINLVSLGQRYEDIKDWTTDANKYKFDKLSPVVSIPALVNLISNWEYQSCEGIANETDFFKMIVEIKKELALLYLKRDEIKYWGIDKYSELENEDVISPAGSINLSRL